MCTSFVNSQKKRQAKNARRKNFWKPCMGKKHRCSFDIWWGLLPFGFLFKLLERKEKPPATNWSFVPSRQGNVETSRSFGWKLSSSSEGRTNRQSSRSKRQRKWSASVPIASLCTQRENGGEWCTVQCSYAYAQLFTKGATVDVRYHLSFHFWCCNCHSDTLKHYCTGVVSPWYWTWVSARLGLYQSSKCHHDTFLSFAIDSLLFQERRVTLHTQKVFEYLRV